MMRWGDVAKPTYPHTFLQTATPAPLSINMRTQSGWSKITANTRTVLPAMLVKLEVYWRIVWEKRPILDKIKDQSPGTGEAFLSI